MCMYECAREFAIWFVSTLTPSFPLFCMVKHGWDVAVELTEDEWTVSQFYAKDFTDFWASRLPNRE